MKTLLRALGMMAMAAAGSGTVAALPQQAECIAPAKAGGGFDLTCALAREMLAGSPSIRTTYLPGGIGALAFTTIVTRRPDDPAAIVAFSGGSLLNLAQGKFGPYSEADVRWLAVVGADYGVVAVRKDSPFRSLADVVRALKADARAISFAAGGTIGSQDWFKAALLARAAGVSHKAMRFVAFEGGGDALSALEGGHVDVFTGDAAEALRHLAGRSGVRLLAVLAEQRLPGALHGVPTAREQGFDIAWPTARGFYLGPGVSEAAHRDWSEAMRRAMASDGFAKQRTEHGLFPLSLTGPDLRRFIDDSMARYRRLAGEFGLLKTPGR